MTPTSKHTALRQERHECPPWIAEAADPTFWDRAWGGYGDGYFEWVNTRYIDDPLLACLRATTPSGSVPKMFGEFSLGAVAPARDNDGGHRLGMDPSG